MNSKSTLTIPEPITQLQRQLDQFRSTQSRRTKLPESLWQAAVELARQHGVYAVARTPRCIPATFARNAAAEKCTARKSRPRWSDSWGTRRWKPPCLRWSGCAAMPADRCSPPTHRRRRARTSTMQRPWR